MEMSTPMFIEVLFTAAETRKHPKWTTERGPSYNGIEFRL